MKNYISIRRLTKNYTNPVNGMKFQALSGIDLRISKGDIISIIGASGAGKTTFLNILGGNIRPSTGQIDVGKINVHGLPPKDLDTYRRHMIGFLWQDSAENLIHGLTVEQNIQQVMSIAGYPQNRREERISTLLDSFDILDRRHHPVQLLSGGEALRASLAVALANDPPMLIADEPTAELDSETSQIILGYLQKINKEFGVTIIVATHDPSFEQIADLNYYLSDGTIVGIKLKNTELGEGRRILLMNSLGQIQIPEDLREKFGISDFVEIEEGLDHLRVTNITEGSESES